MNALETRVSHLETELDKLRTELQAERVARMESDRLRNHAEEQLSTLRIDLAGVKAHRDGLIAEAAEARGHLIEMERVVLGLREDIEKRDRRIVELEREIERRKQEYQRKFAS